MEPKIKIENISEDNYRVYVDSEEYDISYKSLVEKDFLLLGNKKLDKFITIRCDHHVFYLISKKGKLYITIHLNKILSRRCLLFSHISKKNVFFYGIFTNVSKDYKGFDNVFLNEVKVGKIKRFFKHGFLKNFAFIKIPNEKILKSGQIHNNVKVGETYDNSIGIRMRKKYDGINYYSRRRINDQYFIIRTTLETGNLFDNTA